MLADPETQQYGPENVASREVVEDLIVMLAPFAPHFAEENWERLGHDGSIFD